MHLLWETDRWLQKHCVSNTSKINADATSLKKDEGEGNPDNKVISATGSGVAEMEEPTDGGCSFPRSSLW